MSNTTNKMHPPMTLSSIYAAVNECLKKEANSSAGDTFFRTLHFHNVSPGPGSTNEARNMFPRTLRGGAY